MPDAILALDVGGTSLKAAALDRHCRPLPGSLAEYPIPARANRERVLGLFEQAIKGARRAADKAGLQPFALGAGFPGPFDFSAGVSLMAHKLPSIQNLPLIPLLEEMAGGIPVRLLHDSTAYLLGEAFSGAAKGAVSPACLMLGTGLGFAHMQEGKVCLGPDFRPQVLLWNMPFQGVKAEDCISRQSIRERYQKHSGQGEAPDVQQIAALAMAGDRAAQASFEETAQLLVQLLAPLLVDLGCDLLVLGGQIARSAGLFIRILRQGLPVPVAVARHLDDAPLRGAGHYCLMPQQDILHIFPRQPGV